MKPDPNERPFLIAACTAVVFLLMPWTLSSNCTDGAGMIFLVGGIGALFCAGGMSAFTGRESRRQQLASVALLAAVVESGLAVYGYF